MFPKPISWLGIEKLKLTQQKHTFTNQNKYTTTQNTYKKLKPGLVASYDIWPRNGQGLFWFWCFINLSLTYLLRHLPTCLQPEPTWGMWMHTAHKFMLSVAFTLNELRFYVPVAQNRSFQKCSSKPVSWTNLTKQKQTTQQQDGTKHAESKPRSKENLNQRSINGSHMCAYHCAQLSYTIQHRTVLIILSLILLTITIAQMLSNGRREVQL